MPEEQQGVGGPLGPHDFRKVCDVNASRASDGLGWVGLEAARFNDLPASELNQPAITHHEEHLEAGPSLNLLAEVARLSPYHFARQFKAATGLPPHQYLIARRVERAQQLLQDPVLSLAEIAVHSGFSDQSQFSQHFKRLVGVTPRKFRKPARIA